MLARPLGQRDVIALLGAHVEALKGHDPLGGDPRRSGDRREGGQRAQRRARGADELAQVAAVVALRMHLVVVGLRGAGVGCRLERLGQRFVQAAPVRDRVLVGLLGEQVGVVVGGLEGHQRAHHRATMGAWSERGECGGALDIGALAQRVDPEPPQRRIGDLLGTTLPVAHSTAHARKDGQPVAQGSVDERGGQCETLTDRRRHGAK